MFSFSQSTHRDHFLTLIVVIYSNSATIKTTVLLVFTFVHFIIQDVQHYVFIDVLHLDEVCVISEDVLFIVLQLLQEKQNEENISD